MDRAENPLDRSVWSDRTELGRECEQAFAVRYLVVVRTLAFDIPEQVALEVFVVDLQSGQMMAAFPLALRGSYRRGDIGRGRFESEALRQLRSDAFVVARCEVGRRLAEIPGARVDLSEGWSVSGDACAQPPATFRVTSQPLTVPKPSGEIAEERLWPGCAETKPDSPSSIREVNFCNREYLPNLLGLREGRGEMHDYVESGFHDTDRYVLRDVVYGDFEGDGSDEALAVIDGFHRTAKGSTRSDSRLFLFRFDDGHAVVMGDIEILGLADAKISAGSIDLLTRTGEGVCARAYRLTGTRLVEDPAARHCE